MLKRMPPTLMDIVKSALAFAVIFQVLCLSTARTSLLPYPNTYGTDVSRILIRKTMAYTCHGDDSANLRLQTFCRCGKSVFAKDIISQSCATVGFVSYLVSLA